MGSELGWGTPQCAHEDGGLWQTDANPIVFEGCMKCNKIDQFPPLHL